MVSRTSGMLHRLYRMETWIGEPWLDVAGGDAHRENGARAERTRQRELAAEELGQLARERQSQSGARGAPLERALELGELLEDALLVLGSNADAGIGDHEGDPTVGLTRRRDPDLTLFGELERVRDEVPEDLGQLALVGREPR